MGNSASDTLLNRSLALICLIAMGLMSACQFSNSPQPGGADASVTSADALVSDLGRSADALVDASDANVPADAQDIGVAPDSSSPADLGLPGPDARPPEVADPNPNEIPQDSLFICQDQPAASPARIRRLNRVEWLRNVGMNTASAAARNPLDPDDSLHFPTYSKGVTLDAATIDQFLDINHVPGGSWVNRYGSPRLDLIIANSAVLGCFQSPCSVVECENGFTCSNGRCQEGDCSMHGCPSGYRCDAGECVFDQALLPDDECVTQFVTFLLERGVYFRTATEAEVAHLVDFAKAQLRLEGPDGSNRNQTITRTVQAAWLSTGALFRSELGQEPDEHGRRHLTDEELGLALSYALSNRAPGAPVYIWPFSNPDGFLSEIRDAMSDGSIAAPETIARLVRRYAGGIDPGTLEPDADPDELPEEIQALDTRDTRGEYARALAEHAGRFDLAQDFDNRRRSRRGEYYLADKLRDFFHAWLGYGEAAIIFKDRPEATSRFDDGDRSVYRPALSAWRNALGGFYGHEPTMIQLLDDTIARVVIEDRDVLRNLLTTRLFYLPSSVSNPHGGSQVSGYLYDIDTIGAPIGDNRAARWTVLPAEQRAGVLTHPAWLAAHGGNFENDPSAIHRGKWVREHLLCGIVPDVPITVDAQLDPDTVHESARSRVVEKTEAPECVGCHDLMNPLGYPFEIYNHAGYLRESDHGGPPDGSSTLRLMPEANLEVDVRDATEMMAVLADSPHVKRCFIRQNFRYFMGRDETPNDACTLSEMERAYDGSGGSMVEMLIALFNSDTFRYRIVAEEAQP